MNRQGMGHRRTRTADEYDATSGWRHVMIWLTRPRVRSQIKRGLRRRERHDARAALRRREESW